MGGVVDTGHGNYNTAISNHATDPTIRKDLELERDQQGVRGLGCMRFRLVTVWIPGIKTYTPSVCLQQQSATRDGAAWISKKLSGVRTGMGTAVQMLMQKADSYLEELAG